MNWRQFEEVAIAYLEKKEDLNLEEQFELPLGVGKRTKPHKFDGGDPVRKVLVECKTGTWRKDGKVPHGKMTNWNEAMYLFTLAPRAYRKIFIVCRNLNPNTGQSLLEKYLETWDHLVPSDGEIFDYDPLSEKCAIRTL
jgi:hypothetical protein